MRPRATSSRRCGSTSGCATLLRDELGVAPGPQVQAEFERLLKAEQTQQAAPAPHSATAAAAGRAGARGQRPVLRHPQRRPVRRPPRRARLAGRAVHAHGRGPAPARAARGRAGHRQDAARRAVHAGLRGRRRDRPVRPLRRREPHPLPAVRRGAAAVSSRARRSSRLAPWSAELGRVVPELLADGVDPPARSPTDRYRLFDAAARGAHRHGARPAGRARARRPALGRQAHAADAAPARPRGRGVADHDRRELPRHRAARGARRTSSSSSGASTTTRRSRCTGSTRPTRRS